MYMYNIVDIRTLDNCICDLHVDESLQGQLSLSDTYGRLELWEAGFIEYELFIVFFVWIFMLYMYGMTIYALKKSNITLDFISYTFNFVNIIFLQAMYTSSKPLHVMHLNITFLHTMYIDESFPVWGSLDSKF
jgi:hypothetical protein